MSLNWEPVLQVLNIPTKINKGTVEITSNVALIKAGEKVGASEATLLAKLGIKPFSYGLIVKFVSIFTQRLLNTGELFLRQALCLDNPHVAAMMQVTVPITQGSCCSLVLLPLLSTWVFRKL